MYYDDALQRLAALDYFREAAFESKAEKPPHALAQLQKTAGRLHHAAEEKNSAAAAAASELLKNQAHLIRVLYKSTP